ncbi:protein WVD2-like 3 [Pistacia vera]|uniref:protein WVD2-like 3 n=1 Tax=Pistacia vera TaxID=55513 RepID=UPI0012630328|nr:protein WVD2-like 3 [Pistacia vera]
MEEIQQKEEIKQIVLEEQNENPTNKQQEVAEKEELDHLKVDEDEKIVPVLNNNAAQQAAGRVEGNQKDRARKLNQGSKLSNLKSKATVPQPFSLATEKRILSRERLASVDFSSLTETKSMPKERRGSVDSKDLQRPKLTKSVSLSHKTQSLSGPGFGETSKAKHANSTNIAAKTNSKIKVTTTDQHGDHKKMESGLKNNHKSEAKKEIERRFLGVTAKNRQGDELDKDNKLQKSSTFKASPLPSFYHRRNPPSKPEVNKIQAARPKSPVTGARRKSMSGADKPKSEEKGKTVARRRSSNGAKETISKLFKTTKNTLIGSKETMKGVVASA